MLRTDKLYQWAPTQMSALDDRRYPRMFMNPAAAVAEPGAVLDDEQIEAAHAATDVGADEDQAQPGPDGGAIAVLLVAAICCALVALHLYARSF